MFRKTLSCLHLPLVVLIHASLFFGQAPPGSDQRAAKVDELFAQWNKPDSPGCAVGIVQNGRIILARGYGSANLELSVPINPTTVFNAGSISKQFTAFAVLLLARAGKLSLGDDIRKYLPETANFGTPITVEQLLRHTSGLRDFLETLEMAGRRTGDITTADDIFAMVARERTLNHKPGDAFLYTNTGYVLLATIVKRVSGQSFRDFAAENIFHPLGMAHTEFVDDHRRLVPGIADGYLPDTKLRFVKWMPQDDFAGSSNLFTTVEDLALWDQNFYDGKVGGQALIDQMTMPGRLNDGTVLDYGYGLFLGRYRGSVDIFHDGSTLGYQGILHRFPNEHFSISMLCNVRGINRDQLARRIADIYLADRLSPLKAPERAPLHTEPNGIPLNLSEKDLARFTGLYWNPITDNVRRVYVNKGKLMYFRATGNESELAPIGPGRFLMLGVPSRTEIEFSSQRGIPNDMTIFEAGRPPLRQEFVKPAGYSSSELLRFAGLFYSPELDATYAIENRGDKLLIRTGNWGDFLLTARFYDSFANVAEMGSIVFDRDSKGNPAGFTIHSGKVRNLHFVRVKASPSRGGVR